MTRLPSSRTSSYQAFAAFNEELPQNEPSLLHNKIRAAHRAPETELIPALLSSVQVSEKAAGEAYQLAHQLVLDVRRLRTKASGVDALMHEFSLSSEEGVALMCLAEALLRIPDSATAKALIADKISKGQWRKHLGESPSLFVNATTWGLLITGKLLNTQSEQTLSSALTRLIAKGGEPLIRKGVDLAMRLLGNQFVIGQTIENALQNSKNNEARGYRYSYDMLGEAALTEHDAKKYYDAYCDAIHAIGKKNQGRGIKDGAGISIKLSALHPRYQRAQRARVMIELWQRLKELALLCKQYQIGLNIDAEETERLELSLDLLEKLVFEPELKGFDGLGFVVQAYQKRAPFVLDYIIDLARRSGHRLMIRLVKGAYWDSEVKRAQVEGMSDYPVYTRKVYTDVSYLVCAQKLLAANEWIYPQFATHNALTLATVYSWAKERNITDYEFQCLYGMGETLYDQIVGQDKLNIPCRIYAPVGSHETLLAYLVRRLLENGANSSFVNQIVDANISIESLLTDPLKMAADLRGISHPNIAKPRSLYGRQRLNSQGIDFADETVLQSMREPLQELGQRQWQAFPLLAKKFEQKNHQSRAILNPACHADVVGQVIEADSDDVEQAILAAQAHHFSWQQTALTERAQILQKAADLFEQHELELIALAIREAGKSFANAVAEIREAVDFLRYYAQQILLPNWSGESFNETLPGQSLGIVVCISPWNFPLAIFIGQLSAALAAGNVVLAKPAEQTPLIAMRAVELLYQAGLHPAALQFLPGQGETVGAGLVDDARIGGVVFTGSTEVAKIIYASLAERPEEVPLIAETGGQNVMIVDSSALPEQVVQDVITSAFDSAGQRCSALRVLCIQEDVADTMLTMLKGALNELRVGNPDRLSTDIGPVIDQEAKKNIEQHIQQMRAQGAKVSSLELPTSTVAGTFVAPTCIEIHSIDQLKREVFGPVLHILRYRRRDLPKLIHAINKSGYGLTLGIHSRIDETIEQIIQHARVGNIYVNRNMVGAVVGVQPFGGMGLSGTGPKAGGPCYLARLRNFANPPIKINEKSVLPVSFSALAEWALQHQHGSIEALCDEYQNSHLYGALLNLPGPTGENNSLRFIERDAIYCVAKTSDALLNQLAAVFRVGAQAVLPHKMKLLLPKDLPKAALKYIHYAELSDESANGLTIEIALAENELAESVRKQCAARKGALIMVLASSASLSIPLWRLLAEQAVCVNTTAAGGNASLMMMGG